MKHTSSRHNLAFLDGLRGLAALYVMVGHARWLLWEGYSGFMAQKNNYSILDQAQVYFFSAFRYGHAAVMFFFVLSGFVVHLGYASKLANEGSTATFDWKSYFIRRFRRIYPPLVFALLLTAALDYLGCYVLGWQELYFRKTIYPLINQNVGINLNPLDFLGNLLLLMDAYFPTFGTNGPLWSLKYEWWFYMVYPALWYISRYSWKWALFAVAILLLSALLIQPLPILYQQIFSMLPSWWMGVFLADVFTKRIKLSLYWLAGLTAILPIVLIKPFTNMILTDNLTALGFMGVLALLLITNAKNYWLNRFFSNLKWLGTCSYSLYVLHFPILALLSAYLIHRHGILPNHFLWVWAGIVISIIVAWSIHWVIEIPFTRTKIQS